MLSPLVFRYSESNKPRDPAELTKKKRTKPRLKHLDGKDSVSDIYSELLGMTTKADGHYHATATLQELYEEYKVGKVSKYASPSIEQRY